MSNTYVAIMAGGIGSRFWPYSRVEKPKQFLDVMNTGKSLLQITFERFLNVCPIENIFIVTNQDYAKLVQEQLPGITEDQILQEPIRRNTAPCIAYVSQKIYQKNKNATIIVTPSDHLVTQEIKFVETLNKAIDFAGNNEVLLTLGIKPNRPDTGYGYIQYEEEGADEIKKVKVFTEKPNLDLAKTFIKSGDFLWNSGIFVWQAKEINKSLSTLLPEVYDAIESCVSDFSTPKELDAISKAYTQCTSISIDYGVMEKAENVFTLPSNFGWSDIGTWRALYEIYDKDYLGNAVNGDLVQIYDGTDNMIMAPDSKLVVVSGLKGFCVVDTKDVLLITPKEKEQEVKKITTDLKGRKLDNFL